MILLSVCFFLDDPATTPINFLFFESYVDLRDLLSFPTRRSSDLFPVRASRGKLPSMAGLCRHMWWRRDRKITRLNSSHVRISYAVFCLKKKKPRPGQGRRRQATARSQDDYGAFSGQRIVQLFTCA